MLDKVNGLIIVGGILIILGLITAGYTHHKFSSLDPVQATYREHNCHTKKTSSYQKDKDGHRRRVEKKETKCDLTISYNYNGKDYEHTLESVSVTTFKPDTRYVDPNEPEVSQENRTLYVLAAFMAGMGLLFGIGGVYSLKKNL